MAKSNIGNAPVDSIAIGSTNISRAYVGDNVVFGGGAAGQADVATINEYVIYFPPGQADVAVINEYVIYRGA